MKNILMIAAIAAALTACGSDDKKQLVSEQNYSQQPPAQFVQPQVAPQVVQQPAPVIINQQPQHDSGLTNMLLGGVIGHAIGSASNNSNTRIIERESKVYVPPPKYQNSPQYKYSTNYKSTPSAYRTSTTSSYKAPKSSSSSYRSSSSTSSYRSSSTSSYRGR